MYTRKLLANHIDKFLHTCMLVAHMGVIIVLLRKEVTKKTIFKKKQITLNDECIDFCLQTTTNVHLLLTHSL